MPSSKMALIDFKHPQKFSDLVVVSVSGEKLYFSKMALYNTSDYFKSMFDGNFKEANQSKITLTYSPDCLNAIFNLISGRYPFFDLVVLREILSAMREYLMDNLQYMLELYICDKDQSHLRYDTMLLLCTEFVLPIVHRELASGLNGDSIKYTPFDKLDGSILKLNFSNFIKTQLLVRLCEAHKTNQEKMEQIMECIPGSFITSTNYKTIYPLMAHFKHSPKSSELYSQILSYVQHYLK